MPYPVACRAISCFAHRLVQTTELYKTSCKYGEAAESLRSAAIWFCSTSVFLAFTYVHAIVQLARCHHFEHRCSSVNTEGFSSSPLRNFRQMTLVTIEVNVATALEETKHHSCRSGNTDNAKGSFARCPCLDQQLLVFFFFPYLK